MFTKAKRPIGLIVAFAVLAITAVSAPIATKIPKETHLVLVASSSTFQQDRNASALEARVRRAEEQRLAQIAAEAQAEQQRIALAKAAAARASRGSPRSFTGASDEVWAALSRCEAGMRPNAVSRSGKYLGAFQFSLGTWHGIGMSGSPIDYPYEVQLEAAKRLQARSGWGQWPVCSRKLGLR